MMASNIRVPTLAFAGLSICLNAAIIGCAGRTLNIFHLQQKSNDWLLPIWPDHFDLREVNTLIGASAAVLVLNAVIAMAVVVQRLPANLIVLLCSTLGTACSLVAIIFPTILRYHAPGRDTLQTWACRWNGSNGSPAMFSSICSETRFAFYTTIPVFVIQLLLLSMGLYVLVTGGRGQISKAMIDGEKDQSLHELRQVRGHSFETKSESPQSQHVAQMGDKQVL
ncbi:hypothetical protein BAUCODRAFT_115337 [Baudoinia panamericana UAMH 10762]|uniref:Uncharacterized protein n=1 Tax=Baudoinia panamericana (strain UAMH 10762) TaxID=717646 RepID=M2ML25_BAUPA|nr:uncharacterized protein BAUCODRAFT_115337 [Baudoinia panamericana UAMH 10762]EMC92048.1 hypothetical protein BAUCODRAFT_115337 [Baudoinia panamericana UAMH 10762]